VLSDSGIHPGDLYFIAVSYPGSGYPALQVFDSSTNGTLLHSSTDTMVSGKTVLRMVNVSGTQWSYNPEGALLTRNLGAGVQGALSGGNAAAALGGTAAGISLGRGNFVEIGTSITKMWNGTSGPYPTGVGGWLCSGSVGNVFAQMQDYNEGYLGSTLGQWYGGYYGTYAHPYSPAVTGSAGWIRIELGANDFNQSAFSLPSFSSTLDALYTEAHNDGYHIIAVTVTPRSDALTDWQEANRRAINNYIKHDTVLNSGTYRDVIEDRDAFTWPTYTSDPTISWDGVHPTALLGQLEARWLNNKFAGLPAANLNDATAGSTVMGMGLGGEYWGTSYATQMYLTSGTNLVLSTSVANAIGMVDYLYMNSGTYSGLEGQDFIDNNNSLTTPLGFGGLWNFSPPPAYSPGGITATGTAGAYFASGAGLTYTLPAALSGSTGFTMIAIESVATAPAADGGGNPVLSIFDGSNNEAMLLRYNAPRQTAGGIFQNSAGGDTFLNVTGTVPLGDAAAYVLCYDGTNGGYLRVKDLQGTIDQTVTSSAVGTVTPFNSTNIIAVHGRLAPNEGAPYAGTMQGWIIASGSMSATAVNAILSYWQKRLNGPVSYPLVAASGTAYVTGTNAAVVSGTLGQGTYRVTAELTTLGGNPAQIDPQFNFVSDLGTTGTYSGTLASGGASPVNWYNVDDQAAAGGAAGSSNWQALTVHTPGGAFVGSVIGSGTGQTDVDFVIEQLGGQ